MDEKQDANSFLGLMRLLFSFKGRINRARFWTVCIAINIISYPIDKIPVDKIGGDTVVLLVLIALVLIALGFFLSYSGLAISVKRLHDRNKSAWWLLIMLLPALVAGGVALLEGILDAKLKIKVVEWSPSLIVAEILLMVSSLWYFVELGCIRGTVGANQYGPDPLEAPERDKSWTEADKQVFKELLDKQHQR
jgi:uncharacterized membrane protein YhaH (DUF805 family)